MINQNNQIRASNQISQQIESDKAIQEVQASLVIAKKFPRDQDIAISNILKSCKREGLANKSLYSYKRGKELVTGASIRLAEVLALNWGNIEYGFKELSSEEGYTKVESFAWDKETNTRSSRQITIAHKRKAGGTYKEITDPRDIYEHVANFAQRRVRSCILAVIPPDIVDGAIDVCKKTMAGDSSIPLEDRVRKIILAFSQIGVTKAMIEERLGHKTYSIDAIELSELKNVYNSIKDGIARRQSFFDLPNNQMLSKPATIEIDYKDKLLNSFLAICEIEGLEADKVSLKNLLLEYCNKSKNENFDENDLKRLMFLHSDIKKDKTTFCDVVDFIIAKKQAKKDVLDSNQN